MRRKTEALREHLDEFVTQVEYPMLVVGCIPDELVYALKLIEGLNESDP